MAREKKPSPPRFVKADRTVKEKSKPVAYLIKPVVRKETEEYTTPGGRKGTETSLRHETRGHTFRLKKSVYDARDKVWKDVDTPVTVSIPCRTDKCEAQRKGFSSKDMMIAVEELVKSGSQLIAFRDDMRKDPQIQPLAMIVEKLYEADIEAINGNATPSAQREAQARQEDVERQQAALKEGYVDRGAADVVDVEEGEMAMA